MRSTLLSCFLLPLLIVSALGQSTTTVVPAPPPKGATAGSPALDYSAEPIVVEHLDSVYDMAADGTGTKVTTVMGRIQSEASLKQVGVLTIPYAASTQHRPDRLCPGEAFGRNRDRNSRRSSDGHAQLRDKRGSVL